MITEIPPTNPNTFNPASFGMRLQLAREALGLESKDAALQLRLNEKIILMMEKDAYSSDLPPTFIRGYLRSYGKLLQIPEGEIKTAIEPITPKLPLPAPNKPKPITLTSGNYFMQLFTYLIMFTLIGLVVIWWYNHPTSSAALIETPATPPATEVGNTTTNSITQVKTGPVNTSMNLDVKPIETTHSLALPPVLDKNKPEVEVAVPDDEDEPNNTNLTGHTNNTEINSDDAD